MYKRKVVIHEDTAYLDLVKRTIERDYSDIKEPMFLMESVTDFYSSVVTVLVYGENHTKEKADEFLNWCVSHYSKEG